MGYGIASQALRFVSEWSAIRKLAKTDFLWVGGGFGSDVAPQRNVPIPKHML